jgi:CheY-like chemotaxis protein
MSDKDKRIEALEQELEKLQRKSELKDQFFAAIAHELRTPMNAVIGLSQILLTSPLEAKQKEYISKIESSGNILVELVNDILDFSKIEAGKLTIEDIVFDLNDVLENVSQILAIKAHEKGIELVFDLEDRVASVLRGDPLRLGQVLINLMGNAIKFTQSGEVALRVKALDDTTLEFHVKDTGIGLTQEQIERLFQSFSQASVSTSRKYGGSGLGLTISKQLINLMGGDIRVESEYGKGSEFIFTIASTFEEDKRLYHLPSKDLVAKKVLLVDSNHSTLVALENMLGYFKYHAMLTQSSDEATRLIETLPFDMLFIDVKMIKSLKEGIKIHNPDVKVVVLNGAIELHEAESINSFSIDSYLFKPFNLHKVFETILKAYQREIVSLTAKENKLTKRDLARLKGSHIALAEDNKINQTVVMAMLEDTEIEVSVFDNGAELLAYLREENREIDMILMDVNMPIMDGYEATVAIGKESRYKEIPIVALSASKAKKDIDKALEVGMLEHLTKPLYMHDLYASLIRHIHPKVERKTPQLEDLILFNAKFNASVRKFEELFEKGKNSEMERLIIKMEKEANRVDIETLNGMSSVMHDIFKKRQEDLDSFFLEYAEASTTFFNACEVIKNNAIEEIPQEDKSYLFNVLSIEGEALEIETTKALLFFYEQFKASLDLMRYNVKDTPKLQLFADELCSKAESLNAKIMIGLAKSLHEILDQEQEKLREFIERYRHAFDVQSYRD